MKIIIKLAFVVFILQLAACAPTGPAILRLATTTSTDNSDLLDAILPNFEEQYNARVDVVAVGTGQAIALGEASDVDIILVHAPELEEAFIEAGHGMERFDVMYNDFLIVGPMDDIANIRGMQLATNAFGAIAASRAIFASRGDESGTHIKERSIWALAGINPSATAEWYKSIGQGMGATLRFAEEVGAYTLTDRGTYLALKSNLPNLEVLVGGENIAENMDSTMLNPYSLIPVNPEKGNINYDLAQDLVIWLTSLETQMAIANYGIEEFQQPLFYPDSEAWRNR